MIPIYLNTKAGSFSWALSSLISFTKVFFMNALPYEVILRSPHRSSVEEWVSKNTEFKESITNWT